MEYPNLTKLQSINPYAWMLTGCFLNENGDPMEFHKFRFLIEPFMDLSPRQVGMKSSQIGWSTMQIFKDLWLAKYAKANVIHVLPSRVISKDFVVPKVDKIIALNPKIREMVGETDSINLKAVGGRFIYYRGSWDEGEAISISAHVLARDEFDRSKQDILSLYETRLGAAKKERPDLGFIWDFSNPSVPNFGIHALYLKSDQKVWMVKCGSCNRWQVLRWPESIDFKRKVYTCSLCGAELSDETRRMGKWIAQFPDREISGYHVHKLMVPWVSAAEVIEAFQGDTQLFHNFWLGLPYINPDIQVDRGAIVRAIVLTENPKTDVVLGVDNGIEKHWVAGNRYGIFAYGVTRDWRDIERMTQQWDALTVIDALPYPTEPKRLAMKYRGRVFTHFFKPDTNHIGIVRWGEGDDYGSVLVDRTGILDLTADEIAHQNITFNIIESEMERYISHWEAIYRVIKQDDTGRTKVDWVTQSDRPDHWALATELWRVGMEKRKVSAGAGPVTPRPRKAPYPYAVKVTKSGFKGEEPRVGISAPDFRARFEREKHRKPSQKKIFRAVGSP